MDPKLNISVMENDIKPTNTEESENLTSLKQNLPSTTSTPPMVTSTFQRTPSFFELEYYKIKEERDKLEELLKESTSIIEKRSSKKPGTPPPPTPKEKELGDIVETLTEKLEVSERVKRKLEIECERLRVLNNRLDKKLTEAAPKTDDGKPVHIPEIFCPDSKIMMEVRSFCFFINNSWKAREDALKLMEEETTDVKLLQNKINELQASLKEETDNITQLKEYLKLAVGEYDCLKDYSMKSLRKELIKNSICNASGSTNKRPSDYQARIDAKMRSLNVSDNVESTDVLVAKIINMEDEINVKNDKIKSLRGIIQALENENETISLLKAQIQVYQSDFNIERKNRQEIASEREKLLADMRAILKQNNHLLKEIERLQGRPYVFRNDHILNTQVTDFKKSSNHNQATLTDDIEETGQDVFICPNPECSKIFTTLEPLEFHVEQCLKLTD